MTNKRLELTGRRSGRLLVVGFAELRKGQTFWNCVCDCGTKRVVVGTSLSGRTVSCGCFPKEMIRNGIHSHGAASKHSPNYRTHGIWRGMLSRCESAHGKNFKDYVQRGIKVCDEWKSFDNFLRDMGVAPDGLSIERIDNNGNYEPGNCRWATRKEQQNNTRSNRIVLLHGEKMTLTQVAERAGISRAVVAARLARGWSIERAIETPVRARNAP